MHDIFIHYNVFLKNFIFIVLMSHYNVSNLTNQHISISNDTTLVETRIEDGKLLYERRW